MDNNHIEVSRVESRVRKQTDRDLLSLVLARALLGQHQHTELE